MNLSEFNTFLTKTSCLKQIEAALNQYLSTFGFRFFAFTFYSGHVKSGRKLRYDYVSSALRTWHQHYLEQAYADIDRTLHESYRNTLPIFWDVQQQLQQAKNAREKRIRLESIAYGIDKGLSLPVYGPDNDFVTLTLHQCQHEHCLHDYESKQFEWLSATHIFYDALRKYFDLHQRSNNDWHLTRREEQCLTFTAKSYRVEQIAKTLKISPRTVNFHLQNANKKLGTNNKYQAINKYLEIFK